MRTEQAYVQWIRRFILFHHKRHPQEMGEQEIREFISDLAVNGKISASTQTVALSALLFLYREVLKKELPYVHNIERAKQRKKLPGSLPERPSLSALCGGKPQSWRFEPKGRNACPTLDATVGVSSNDRA